MNYEQKLKVISALRKGSRRTLAQIHSETKLPLSTMHNNIKSLKKDKIIKKFTTVIDFAKLGFHTRAIVLLKVNKEDKMDLKERLLKDKNVNWLAKVCNGYDFMVEVVFEHIRHLEEFLELLEEDYTTLKKELFYIIEDLKQDAFLSNPKEVTK